MLRHLESLRAAGVEWISRPTSKDRQGRPSHPSSAVAGDKSAVLEIVMKKSSDASAKTLYADADPSAQPQAAPAEERLRSLAALADRVRTCSRMRGALRTRTQTVFGVGRIDPDLCFVGEAPGADEDARGEPFVGAAGQLLNKIIVACGLKREEVYICNILKCRPPEIACLCRSKQPIAENFWKPNWS